MNFHNITYPDMNNGSGLRVVLWLSGCNHRCYKCQNPQTWDVNSGIPFDENAKEELFRELSKDYISGITFTGGDPLHENNLEEVFQLIKEIYNRFPDKTVWLYTGFRLEDIGICNAMNNFARGDICFQESIDTEYNNLLRREIISMLDVLVDGQFIESEKDISLHWKGSSNQRVINVQESLKKGEVILWDTN